MFNIGAGEMILIALVLLIAVGPEQLPSVIRRTGQAVGQLRSMSDRLRADFMSSMDEIERAADPRTWAESGLDGAAEPGSPSVDAAGATLGDEPDEQTESVSEEADGTSSPDGPAFHSAAPRLSGDAEPDPDVSVPPFDAAESDTDQFVPPFDGEPVAVEDPEGARSATASEMETASSDDDRHRPTSEGLT